jgi:hypothetical protein
MKGILLAEGSAVNQGEVLTIKSRPLYRSGSYSQDMHLNSYKLDRDSHFADVLEKNSRAITDVALSDTKHQGTG